MIVKAPIAAVLMLTGALLGVPVVIGGNGSSSAADCNDLSLVLDTIRTLESGGDYTTPTNPGGASGGYQYIDSTWSGFGGYDSAYLAPAEVQDAKATGDVQAILATYGDVAFVPIVWYWPKAADDPGQLDIVPMPGAGNTLTVREYQENWLDTFESKRAATPVAPCTAASAAEDGYSLPLDRTLIAAQPSMLDQPHHDYPAIDLLVPEGSPVYAVRGGTVARLVDWPHNCWAYGRCDQTCGVGVSVNGDDGARYIYCHGTHLNGLAVGDQVAAGQLLMWSGNTGQSGTPHLHFELRVDGQQRCPQLLLRSLFDLAAEPPITSLAGSGCSF